MPPKETRLGADEGTEAAGVVRSTEEPRGSTEARPKRSTDAGRRFRAEHRGTEGEHRGEAEGFVRSTEWKAMRRGAKKEHQGEAKEPMTAKAKEGTEQEHRRG